MIMGDFNVNLINCNNDRNTNNFLDVMLSHSFVINPTRITKNTKTLIYNIFYNKSLNDIMC